MSLVMAGFLVYIFFIGLLGEAEKVEALLLDVSDISPGEHKVFNAGKRKLLVLHRTPENIASLKNSTTVESDVFRSRQPRYFVAWAYDPILGCAIEYQQDAFKSVCANNYYDLAGRVIKGAATADDLRVPDYRFVDDAHISINVIQ